MRSLLPGAIGFSGFLGVVQPQLADTFSMINGLSQVLVTVKKALLSVSTIILP